MMFGVVKQKTFWRDILVEIFATFILVSIQCALPLKWYTPGQTPDGFGDIVQMGLGMGFLVCATSWTFGDFGGCIMNPAITVCMVVSMKLPVFKGICYILAQCLGAVAGAGFMYAVTPESRIGSLAATMLNSEVTQFQGVLVEIWLTLILGCVVLGASNQRRKGNIYMPTIIVGFFVTTAVLSGTGHTGASMNPARSFGPAVIMGIWTDHWIYWVGPIIGATLAAVIYHHILDKIDLNEQEDKKHCQCYLPVTKENTSQDIPKNSTDSETNDLEIISVISDQT